MIQNALNDMKAIQQLLVSKGIYSRFLLRTCKCTKRSDTNGVLGKFLDLEVKVVKLQALIAETEEEI